MRIESIVVFGCICLSEAVLVAQERLNAGTDFFEAKIRPILVTHCYECHSRETGKAKGGLQVDSRAALQRGGDTGPAVVAGSVAKSQLFQALTYEGNYQMPPKGKLPDDVIADFRKWIVRGATDPRTGEIQNDVSTNVNVESGRSFWAYRPLHEATPGEIDVPWARNRIDQFVSAEQNAHGLKPVADATPQTLIRRLHFVLTGIPPQPEDMNSWTTKLQAVSTDQDRQIVVGDLVDELLGRPQFGERWGRHWMDVVRFSESTGGDQNNVFQHAWRYRDWIIDAFNDDMPYDEFIRAQIAGDLLPIENDQEWAENIVATGFLTIGVKLVGEEDQQKYFADLVDEQIDATSRAFLATSVACARCHDHKYDPIPQSDYYALAAIFRATETHYGLLKAQARQATTLIDLTGIGVLSGGPTLSKEQYATLVKQRDDARRQLDNAMKKIRSGENVFRGLLRKYRSDRDKTEAALQAVQRNGQSRIFAMGTQDRDYPIPTRLLIRGELDQPAQEVPAGILQVLSPHGKHTLSKWTSDPEVRKEKAAEGLGATSYRSTSGRLELAQWIASVRNPLTARVMVNRIWHWMFGRGIVRTVDEFGSTGDPPTHPELLDYLAKRYIQSGWSTKRMIREIALSRTWQLSAESNEANYAHDPDNRFLWRANHRRLEAEALRDAMLAVSGELDLQRPVGTLLRKVGEGNVGQNVFEPEIRAIQSKHRSVYLPRVRGVLPEMLELFDAPDASLVSGARATTSSPLQSLYMMNNPFVRARAEGLMRRILRFPPEHRIENAYKFALGRQPSDRERHLATRFIDQLSGSQLTVEQKLSAYCQTIFCTSEFAVVN